MCSLCSPFSATRFGSFHTRPVSCVGIGDADLHLVAPDGFREAPARLFPELSEVRLSVVSSHLCDSVRQDRAVEALNNVMSGALARLNEIAGGDDRYDNLGIPDLGERIRAERDRGRSPSVSPASPQVFNRVMLGVLWDRNKMMRRA